MFLDGELNELVRICRIPLEQIEAMVAASKIHTSIKSPKRLKLFPSSKQQEEVSNEWIKNRLIYIRDYIDWLAAKQCGRFSSAHEHYLTLSAQRTSARDQLTAAMPSDKGRNVVNQRMGLGDVQQEFLLKLIEPTHSENVWVGHHCRARNELMVLMFIKLGIRRGELAGISVRDISFRARTLLIRRHADDKLDPRDNQPNAKTLDRILPLSNELCQRIQQYVIRERKAQKKASMHPFLFVANGGRALGLRAINKVFEALAERFGQEELVPHVLRHTFNENLSKQMEADKIEEADEVKIRSELNGWNPTSGTAATYTKRTIQRRARKASLALQENQPVKPIVNDE